MTIEVTAKMEYVCIRINIQEKYSLYALSLLFIWISLTLMAHFLILSIL